MQKDNNKKDIIIQDRSYIDSFFPDNNSLFIYKKSERISAVIFYIKDNFNDNDDLQKSLLRTAREVMSYASCLIRTPESYRTYVDQLAQSLMELSGCLKLAHISGYVHEGNYNLLQSEIHNVIRIIKSEGIRTVDESFFSVSSTAVAQVKTISQTPHASAPRTTSQTPQPKQDEQKMSDRIVKNIIFNKQTDKGHKTVKDTSVKDSNADRKGHIKDIIKDMKKVSIKDISDRITDCSQKTIQRILNDMVSSGELKKEGERRWSTYTLP